MQKLSQLLTRIDNFYKLALNFKLDAIIDNTKMAINAEISAGINALNRLMQNPQYSASTTLQTLDEGFNHLSQMNRHLDPKSDKEEVIQMLQYLGSLEFYTNVSNTGTGYDPLTHVGGVTSLSAYVDRIKTHLERLVKVYTNPNVV